MQYFDTLPKIIKTDANRNSIVMTDLMARCSIIPEILNNPMVYYDYDVQDGDTPEIVAYKYYGDSYRYWVVLFANQITDPQWDWPLNSNDFDAYITNKYPSFNPYSTVHHYEKIVTQYDATTQTTTTKNIIIDQTTYNSLITNTNTYTLPTGSVTITISKAAVSYYDYELNLNESKRSIKILNSGYVEQLEKQFTDLMAA
jgi:hypothetical protein